MKARGADVLRKKNFLRERERERERDRFRVRQNMRGEKIVCVKKKEFFDDLRKCIHTSVLYTLGLRESVFFLFFF